MSGIMVIQHKKIDNRGQNLVIASTYLYTQVFIENTYSEFFYQKHLNENVDFSLKIIICCM